MEVRPKVEFSGVWENTQPSILRTVDDPGLPSGQVVNLRGASSLAVAALQAALDSGQYVIALDAINCHNRVDRAAAFEYLTQRPEHYAPAFNLISLLYSRQSEAKLFNPDGSVFASLVVADGVRQGCLSAALLHRASVAVASNKFFPNLVQVSDDTHIIAGPGRPEIYQDVIDTFLRLNQDLRGNKAHIIAADDMILPDHLRHLPRSSCKRTLGGILCAGPVHLQSVLQVSEPILEKAQKRATAIVTADTSAFIKLHLLRTCSTWYKHYAATIHRHTKNVMEAIDAIHITAVQQILVSLHIDLPPPLIIRLAFGALDSKN